MKTAANYPRVDEQIERLNEAYVVVDPAHKFHACEMADFGGQAICRRTPNNDRSVRKSDFMHNPDRLYVESILGRVTYRS
jgi:hypothetical protein